MVSQLARMAQRVWDELLAIQYGKVEHPWSVLV